MMRHSGFARASKYRASNPPIEALECRRLLSSSPVTSAANLAASRIVMASVASPPTVTTVSPANGDTGVARNASITANVSLPNGRLDSSTVNSSTVKLVRNSDSSVIPSVVNTTGGGDAIILQPSMLMDPNTTYTFTVTSGVKDVSGTSMTAYSETFTTGTSGGVLDPNLAFQKVPLDTATGTNFTCVRIGPDHDLYASTEDGRIFRYVIEADGTLSLPQVIYSLQTANNGNRLITGFAFDPASTANNLKIWVSNTFYALSGATNGPDFTGKLTVMSGSDLQNVGDAVINLPRSVADHVNNQPVFGPDGALYFDQAGNNAYGAPDSTWGNRTEHLLTAAILRLDTSKITPGAPLDAKTVDVGGSYNPYAPGAPLTIYADGLRNVYSLLFDSSGTLWAPMNGSSSGGNSPAFTSGDPNQVNGPRLDTGKPYSGPNVPGLTNIQQTEDDYMYKIAQGGYYGHPDPARGEYVLDGGNPTSGVDPAEFSAYPVGTQPDPNYRGYAYDFGQHRSPDGIIEYQGNAFGGALNGKLLVAEYSAGDDIAVLSKDANGNIISADRTVSGLTNFINPVDLTEDPNTGNIYVAELGGQRLTLLRPMTPGPQLTASQTALAFNAIAAGYSGAAPSRTDTVTITNSGSATLTFSAPPSIANDPSASSQNAADFAITNAGSFPTSLAPGQSASLSVQFTASQAAFESALLQLQSNDPAHPTTSISLHGVGTPGQFGTNEPSLVQVLRAFDIPTIVGAGPNDVNSTNPTYPENPDPSSQEVPMSRMVKAGTGPVTITPLASFNASAQPTVRFGYYTPGDATNPTELFTIGQSDAQTFNPTLLGASSFDPGNSTFSLYATFPGISTSNGQPDTHYSEDVYNTALDPANPRKMRFFPLENADKTIVPNAYIVATEDYNGTQYNSFVNFVGILRNVKPAIDASNAPVLGLENLQGPPSDTRMVFSRNQIPSTTITEVVHDTGVLRLHNSGDQPLVIQSLTLSDATNWQLINPPAPGTSIAPGSTLDVTIKFVAQTDPPHTTNETNDTATTNGVSVQAAGGVWNGTLTIATNDPVNPTRGVQLSGYWQYQSEHENEPGLQTITNLMFGYGTNISNTFQPDYPNGSTATYYGEEETQSGLWNIADSTLPITVRQLAAYHQQVDSVSMTQTAAAVEWYAQGSSTNHFLFQHQKGESQTVFPDLLGSFTAPAEATFTPSGTFGWYLDGEHSQDSLNTTDINTYGREGHAVRFWPARDTSGNIIANTWIMAMDYQNGPFDNSDFQDNVYLITNMAPAVAPATPADLQVTQSGVGINLQWAPVSGATGYNVYRSSNGGAETKLNSSPLTSAAYTDGFAPDGTKVSYRVTAVGSGGAESVGANASLQLYVAENGTGPGTQPPPVVNPPTAPTNLTADASSKTQVVLNWSASSNADSYHVERQGPSDSSFIEIASGLTSPSFIDTNVVKGATYQYRVRAQNSGGFSDYSNVASAALPMGVTLDATAGAGANRQVRFIDSDGTITTILLNGPGDATVHFAGDAITPSAVKGIETITGTNVVITSISTTGTDTRTTLNITARRGHKSVDIGGISADAALGTIDARTANLIGGLLVNGALNKLILGSANNAALSVNGPLGNVQINSANHVSLSAMGAIRNIQANVWSSAGLISAPSIANINIKHDASFALSSGIVHSIHVGGSLHDSTLTLTAPGALDLTTLSVGGMTNSTLSSAGNLGQISAGSLLDSDIYAGARPAAGQALPALASDFTAQAFIRSVSLRKHKGITSDVNSSIAADQLNNLSLGVVQFANNGTPFGVAAQFINSIAFTESSTGKSFVLRKLNDPNAVAGLLSSKGITPQDFALRIL